jgi:Transposase DNA-binding/Transposase DDE domain
VVDEKRQTIVIQLSMPERLESDAIAQMLYDLTRADLGDPRRVARAQAVVERLAAKPNASLPDAMVSDAELEGAYRLFSNDRVSFEQLFDAHALGTAERACASKLVLAIHDTTSCTFRHADPEEVGYLNTGKPGFPLHLTLVVDTEPWRRPLGLAHAEVLPRQQPPARRGTRKKKPSSHHSSKDQQREFLRWHRGIESTEARFEGTATSIIHVADRESDSYVLMATCIRQRHRFIFRARNNRNVLEDGVLILIRDLIADAPVVFEREVPLSRRLGSSIPERRRTHPPRESRVARLRFSATKATFKRPNIVGAEWPKTLEVNVLHVFEENAPKGQEPVDWLLYTTEPLDTQEQIENVVDYYRCRWQIEELNKALKTGCVVQERRLESLDALTTMLALSLPIAVELLALRTLARTDSSAPAALALTASQLAALRHMSHRPLPKKPTVQDALWCIAGLGGHIKNNGAPGWQVLQRGMEKFVAFAAGWCAREAADL